MNTPDLFGGETDIKLIINDLFSELAATLHLAPNRLVMLPHRAKEGNSTPPNGEKPLTTTRDESIDIRLEEMPYPLTSATDEVLKARRSSTICYFNLKNSAKVNLAIKPYQYEKLPLPATASIGTHSPAWQIVSFAPDDPNFISYLRSLIILTINTYDSGASFGCCSRFNECQTLGYCTHDNTLYAKGCFLGHKFLPAKEDQAAS